MIHKIFLFGEKNRNGNQIEIGCCSSGIYHLYFSIVSFRNSSMAACIQVMNQRPKTTIILEKG